MTLMETLTLGGRVNLKKKILIPSEAKYSSGRCPGRSDGLSLSSLISAGHRSEPLLLAASDISLLINIVN